MASEQETIADIVAWKRERGNAAAMREACKAALSELDKFGQVHDGRIHLSDIVHVNKARGELQKALSTPPRNCDMGTAEEQGVRYEAYCRKHFTPGRFGGSCHRCPLEGRRGWSCQIAWAQMPYEAEAEKKGECDGR